MVVAEILVLVVEIYFVVGILFGIAFVTRGVQAIDHGLAVDGVETPDLDSFLAVVRDKPNRGPVRLKIVDLDGKVQVLTLKLDLEYWPTYELIRGDDGWKRTRIEPLAPVDAVAKPESPDE